MSNNNGDRRWHLTKEKILTFSGLGLIFGSFINAEIIGGTFHLEFVLAGLALCGIALAQWGDHRK